MWNDFWSIFWLFFWGFALLAYLIVLFSIIADIFRDHTLGGGWKAVWFLFLVFLPFATALVYLIARGKGMSERSAAAQKQASDATTTYIREVAGSSPTEEISKAKALLDAGTITQAEFDGIKTKALSA